MMSSSGGTPSSGTSIGTRLVVFTATAGALGYAVVYFFDPRLGEERRRRVLEAAQAAITEVVSLSQRLVAPAPEQPARQYEPALPRATEPVAAHEPEPQPEADPDITDTLHEKVTFFRLGEEEPVDEEAAPMLAPVAVITEELPASPERASYEPPAPARAPMPTIIAYDADRRREPEPERELEPEPADRPHSGRTLLAAAAVVVVLAAAAALGAWAIWSGGGSTKDAAPASSGEAQLVSLMSHGGHGIPVAGSHGTMVLVMTPSGQAVLVVSNLKRAPAGKVYQAWIVKGKTPLSAGLFKGGQAKYVIPLSQRVPKGSVFAITLERTGGVPAPTQKPEYAATIS